MRIPLNKSAAQTRIDNLEERMAVIEHGLLFELEGVLTDRELEEWLVRSCRIDTQSDETSSSTPSTAKQLDLSGLLVDALNDMGAADVVLTGYGAVLATIPGVAEHGLFVGLATEALLGTPEGGVEHLP